MYSGAESVAASSKYEITTGQRRIPPSAVAVSASSPGFVCFLSNHRQGREDLRAGIRAVVDPRLDGAAAVLGGVDQTFDMLGGKENVTAEIERFSLWFGQLDAHVVVHVPRGGAGDRLSLLQSLGIDLEAHRLPVSLLKGHGVHLHRERVALAAFHLRHLAEIGGVAFAS